MPTSKKLIFLLIILISIIPVSLSIDPQQPTINVTLTKDKYIPESPILGSIDFKISGPIENQHIKADISNIHTQITFIDALKKLNLAYRATPPVRELYGDLSQGIVFPPQAQLIGFEASYNPRSVKISNAPEARIFGLQSNGNYPNFPYIDLRADGTVEWLYLGNLTSWETTYKQSGFLDENVQDHDVLVRKSDPPQYLCEIINIGKDVNKVNVSVRYKLANNDVTVKVKALGPPQSYTQDGRFRTFGIEECSLPQVIGQNSQWASCNITFIAPRIRNADTMFCVYATTQGQTQDLFYLDHDNSGSTTPRTADCELTEQQDFLCRKRTNRNYFIKINLPIYDGILNTGIVFEDGLINPRIESFEDKVKDSLSGTLCAPDELGNCIVKLEVGSQSEGIIAIPPTLMRVDGATVEFKKYREKLEIVTNISNTDLTRGFNLTIPLSLMENLTAPQVPYIQIIPLKISFGSISIFRDIEIDPSALIFEEDPKELINITLEKIERYMSDPATVQVLEYKNLNLNSKKTSLLSYLSQIHSIENNATMNEQNKTAAINSIKTQVTELVKDVPQELFILNDVLNIPTLPPTQIPDSYLPENKRTSEVKEYVLATQNKAQIETRAIAYKLKAQTEEVAERTLIIRDIRTPLANPYIIEEIPQSLASVNEIGFKQPAVLIGQGATLKQEIRLGSGKLTYEIFGDVTDQIAKIRTLVVSIEGASLQEEFETPICGDGTCTIPLEDKLICPEDCSRKIPWITITTIVIILLLLLAYINVYKGKYSFQSFFNKRRLFKTEADKINLINYVERASTHMSFEKVKKILLSKGWDKDQINSAIEQVAAKRKNKPKFYSNI